MERLSIPADWTFKTSDVAAAFDSHVHEQLPWYDLATGMVAHIARHYIPEGGLVYDLGASTGNIGRALADCILARSAELVAIESSPEMVSRYTGPGRCIQADVTDFSYEAFDVAIAFLTFMFVPVADRRLLLGHLVESVRPGGALILVDKQELPAGYLGTVLRRLTLAGKVATGTPSQDIVEKELSLSGIQRPMPQNWPPGGTEVFRFGEFVGWVIEAQEVTV